MDNLDEILKLIELHDARADAFQRELDSIHVEWQRDIGRYIRVESQIEALLSIVAEFAVHSGVSESHVLTCFRERFLRFQEQQLLEYENVAPDLAAQIDNRVEGETLTTHKFQRLFPD